MGTLPIQRRYNGIGKINLRSGTKDAERLKKIHVAMDETYEMGKKDVLEKLRDGVISVDEFYASYKSGDLKSIGNATSIQGLKSTQPDGSVLSPLFEWSKKRFEASNKTGTDYRSYFNVVLRFASDASTVADLPVVLRKMRDHYGKSPVMFNRTRAAVRSYLSDTLGRYDPLYAAVSNIKILKVTTTKRVKHLSVQEVRDLVSLLPNYGGMVWTCCVTGMRVVSEYLANNWEIQPNGIHIKGTKTERSDRMIPYVKAGPSLVTARAEYKTFRQAVRKASKRQVKLGDFRKTYLHWCELAGIPRARRKHYAAHAKIDTQDDYEMGEWKSFLKEDAKRLSDFISRELKKKAGLVLSA